MPQTDPGALAKMEKTAVDLGDVAKRHAEEKAAAEAEALRLATARVNAWERAMQRTFKGIVPRPQRRAQLERAAAKATKS